MTAADGSEKEGPYETRPKNRGLPGPEVIKNVTEIGTDLDSFAINDVNNKTTWILRGGVPADIINGELYIMTDVMDECLTYDKEAGIAVAVDSANVLAGKEETKLVEGSDYGIGYDEATNTIDVKLTKDGMKKVAEAMAANTENANGDEFVNYKDMEIRVYINTIINEDAIKVTGNTFELSDKILNDVKLQYRNSVGFLYEDFDDAAVYTCGINLYKYDAKDKEKALAGAEFVLAKVVDASVTDAELLVTKKNETVNVVYASFYTVDENGNLVEDKKVTTDENGKAILYGLDEGEYYLVETKAPEGYNLLSYPVEVIVNQDSDESVISVANSNQFKLPATGGVGTTIFTMSGASLMAAAVVLLAMKKKREEA